MSESALIVEVPEAESYVAALRQRFDPTAALGVPAHVTVLSPFMDVSAATAEVISRVAQVLRRTRRFAFDLEHAVPWPTVAFLAARPRETFNAMTRAITGEFPDYQPYGGAHADLIPHVTFAAGDAHALAAANEEMSIILARLGPLRSTCSEVTWIENSTGLWKTFRRIRLSN